MKPPIDLVLLVLQTVAPVFVLAAAGFAWVRAGWDYPVPFVTQLAMTIGVPCLIFGTLVGTTIAPAALSAVALATALAYGALAVLLAVFVAASGLDRRTYLGPLIFGNTGNLGLPLALFAFGEAGLGYAVVIFALMAVGTFTLGIWLVAGAGSGWRVLREPMVGASVLGVLFLWQGWSLPVWIAASVDLAGQLGIPLMLLTLGVAVARLAPGRLGRAVWLAVVKAGLSAAVALATGWLLGLDPVARAVLVTQMVTPVAVTSYLLAEKYDADAPAVAGLVVVSTLLSALTLPLALGLVMPAAVVR